MHPAPSHPLCVPLPAPPHLPPDPPENPVPHPPRQPPGIRVLPAGMVGRDQGGAVGQTSQGPVAEGGARGGREPAPPPPCPEPSIVGGPAPPEHPPTPPQPTP